MKEHNIDKATILFAGDSGDGMQLTGGQFSNTTAHQGTDLSTFPDFPAEIRAPRGTVAGVSGFQINFGSVDIHSPGDLCDVLVAMNAAALVKNGSKLKKNGILIANTSGFDSKNLKLAKCEENPIHDAAYKDKQIFEIDVTKLTKEALKGSGLSSKEVERSKNMFVLGFIYWLYNREISYSIEFLEHKFANKPEIAKANITVLKAGYHYGDTNGVFTERFTVSPAKMDAGLYRNITGNHATAIGLVAASKKANLDLFYGGYPITPASDVLHYLSSYKNYGVKTFQAEDEIAGIASAIGASYGGNLGTTATSGPGMALKGEALGLALMLEIPLVIVNVQRGGPSTGLPTKTEQSDLNQALYGRNGDAPIPVIAAKSPSDCFYMAYEASRIALEHMTPVILLTDGFIANGSEPWKFPKEDDLGEIEVKGVSEESIVNGQHQPYLRDENLVREWAIPGTKGYENRVGGLEKEDKTGNVSYNGENHQVMTKIRAEKVAKIADFIPEQTIDNGKESGKVLIMSWGSTYGSIKTAMEEMLAEGMDVSHTHLQYIFPFPKNLGDLLSKYDKILVPELNNGQLVNVLRSTFAIDAIPFNKIKGVPFYTNEIVNKVRELL
ncbi:2-oxoacid:acceptor oxidoreductase subunit alpha [Aureivirga sp. CE67]|uniref:2-oxoacid:acceptor oxidoreductase subunit alpha n=1 Tax=Aureivirga sp. CE67 TaxID=1788983 RepID=UPI0018C9D21D|nr:2-oxoacid:acceptor oxidoreductase subunit alpha [Aureivirga sp. CE67]